MNVTWLDWFGYAASVVILISLTMSSIIRLRWFNLAGAIMFAAFGFLIGSIPTGALNLGIAVIDIFYLARLYRARDEIAVVQADVGSTYFEHIWSTNLADINRFFGEVRMEPEMSAFYLLRNNITAGILLGRMSGESRFEIVVEYATPAYRDFKMGDHLFVRGHLRDAVPGVASVTASGGSPEHTAYLKKLGFSLLADDVYTRSIG